MKAFWWLIFSYNIWYWATSQLALSGNKVFSQLNRDKLSCLLSALEGRRAALREGREGKIRIGSNIKLMILEDFPSLREPLRAGNNTEGAQHCQNTLLYQIYRTLFTLSINMSSVCLARCLLYLFSLHIYNQCIRFQTVWRTKYNKQHNSE